MLTNYTVGKFTSDKIEFCVILHKFMRWWHDLCQFAVRRLTTLHLVVCTELCSLLRRSEKFTKHFTLLKDNKWLDPLLLTRTPVSVFVRRREAKHVLLFYDKPDRKLNLTKVGEYSASIEVNQPSIFCMEYFIGQGISSLRSAQHSEMQTSKDSAPAGETVEQIAETHLGSPVALSAEYPSVFTMSCKSLIL